MTLDTSWTTAVVAVLGTGATLTLALLNRRDSARREKLQLDREDAKEAGERVRAQRTLERASVMKLSDIFADARRLSDRPPEEDPPGMDWDEEFPTSWEPAYYSAMRESELVSNQEFREVFQECAQAILWCSGLSQVPKAGPARRIARDTASLGFVVAGSWLRDEAVSSDAKVRFKALQALVKDAEEIWDERSLKSPGEEPS